MSLGWNPNSIVTDQWTVGTVDPVPVVHDLASSITLSVASMYLKLRWQCNRVPHFMPSVSCSFARSLSHMYIVWCPYVSRYRQKEIWDPRRNICVRAYASYVVHPLQLTSPCLRKWPIATAVVDAGSLVLVWIQLHREHHVPWPFHPQFSGPSRGKYKAFNIRMIRVLGFQLLLETFYPDLANRWRIIMIKWGYVRVFSSESVSSSPPRIFSRSMTRPRSKIQCFSIHGDQTRNAEKEFLLS